MEELSKLLNMDLDSIILQLEKGNTIEGLKSGRRYFELEQVKEWKSRFGYQLHIYSNDHFIDNKPHFHLINPAESIDCKFFFDGGLIDCKGRNVIKKKVLDALNYFISIPTTIETFVRIWNNKNPDLCIDLTSLK